MRWARQSRARRCCRGCCPTSNGLIGDPRRRLETPAGRLGADLAYAQRDFDDRDWRMLDLPHDWGVEGTFTTAGSGGRGRLPFYGVGWYRRLLDIPAADAGHSIFLDVDGAMSYAAVWLNGEFVGGWPYGYASWRVDLTPLREARRAQRHRHPPRQPRGLFSLVSRRRHLSQRLARQDGAGSRRPLGHVRHDAGGFRRRGDRFDPRSPSTTTAADDADVTVSSEIVPIDAIGTHAGAAVAMRDTNRRARRARILRADSPRGGRRNSRASGARRRSRHPIATRGHDADAQRHGRRHLRDAVRHPLASASTPTAGSSSTASTSTSSGVCIHHDLGALGAAVNDRALERQLEMLIEMGCNAIRTSHNPPAPELLELTDRMGFS